MAHLMLCAFSYVFPSWNSWHSMCYTINGNDPERIKQYGQNEYIRRTIKSLNTLH